MDTTTCTQLQEEGWADSNVPALVGQVYLTQLIVPGPLISRIACVKHLNQPVFELA